MLIVAVLGLIFNLIQMKILHSGDGHYHLGGEHDHGEGHGCSGHGHGHEHGHVHGHGHKHGNHKKSKGLAEDVKNDLLTNQANIQADHDDEESHSHHSNNSHHNDSHAGEHAHGEGMLVDAAFLHVLGDMIMSVGVIIAAIIIYVWPDLWWMDPICTYFFSIIVVVTTIPIIKNCMKVMMEAAPEKINVE